MNKRITKIAILTLAVMAILLRPFFAYHLLENAQIEKDPVAINTLLQRLIKKKDDHHISDNRELIGTISKKKVLLLPFTTCKQTNFRRSDLAISRVFSLNLTFKSLPTACSYVLNSQYRI